MGQWSLIALLDAPPNAEGSTTARVTMLSPQAPLVKVDDELALSMGRTAVAKLVITDTTERELGRGRDLL